MLLNGIRTSACGVAMLAALLLSAHAASAVPDLPAGTPDGGCWADPMNNLTIKLTSANFSSNTAGSIAKINYRTTPTNYNAWCYSTVNKYIFADRFDSEINLPISYLNAGYHKLTDEIDYKLSIKLSHAALPPVVAPFSYQLGTNPGGLLAGPKVAGVSKLNPTPPALGSTGIIEFKLRKTLIGGAFNLPGGIEIGNLYRYIYSPAPEPIYRLYTEQFVVPVPVECRINNGTLINVPFGNVDSSLLTSSASTSPYHVERALSYQCNTSLSQVIKVVLAAAPAGFSGAVKTSNKDIGVVMLYNNQPVPPNGSYVTTLVNGTGSDAVSFSVVKRGGTSPATGPFTGSATLIISSL